MAQEQLRVWNEFHWGGGGADESVGVKNSEEWRKCSMAGAEQNNIPKRIDDEEQWK